MNSLRAVISRLVLGSLEVAPEKHYVVRRIVNPSRIPGRISNPSYIANNPG